MSSRHDDEDGPFGFLRPWGYVHRPYVRAAGEYPVCSLFQPLKSPHGKRVFVWNEEAVPHYQPDTNPTGPAGSRLMWMSGTASMKQEDASADPVKQVQHKNRKAHEASSQARAEKVRQHEKKVQESHQHDWDQPKPVLYGSGYETVHHQGPDQRHWDQQDPAWHGNDNGYEEGWEDGAHHDQGYGQYHWDQPDPAWHGYGHGYATDWEDGAHHDEQPDQHHWDQPDQFWRGHGNEGVQNHWGQPDRDWHGYGDAAVSADQDPHEKHQERGRAHQEGMQQDGCYRGRAFRVWHDPDVEAIDCHVQPPAEQNIQELLVQHQQPGVGEEYGQYGAQGHEYDPGSPK